ncbi:hypothetical protein [Natronolimnohabitans innermongolicus]|uniref:Uncharacterized protein n=1 Tax=Natronolimnohabitans innermongolicus JCM 12255 TaxID=1227499 RepID=L9XHD5_9EURY|nr:hypothetical protein [Natronolimnohabitans innermongolicus]ELY61154.1 hypothetical protein C493_02533 [Natronolimnohabitans innermongolicus JCM 12255]
MVGWIVRDVVPWIVVWTAFAYVTIVVVEFVAFGRVDWLEPFPGVLGAGIGVAFAQRLLSFSPLERGS